MSYTPKQKSEIEYLISRGKAVFRQKEEATNEYDKERLQGDIDYIRKELNDALNAEAMYRAHLRVAQEHIKAAEELLKNDIDPKDYIAESELTVTITLKEYRDLIKESVENKQKKDKLDWWEQYRRAEDAEKRIKELEAEKNDLYKRLAVGNDDTEEPKEGEEEW